jgi:hypothetical protein
MDPMTLMITVSAAVKAFVGKDGGKTSRQTEPLRLLGE